MSRGEGGREQRRIQVPRGVGGLREALETNVSRGAFVLQADAAHPQGFPHKGGVSRGEGGRHYRRGEVRKGSGGVRKGSGGLREALEANASARSVFL